MSEPKINPSEETAVTASESMTPEIEHVWRQYHRKLGAFIRSRVAEEDADDILHDLFFKMRAKLPQLENPDRLQSWLFRIASNAIIDHYRSKRPTEELPEWVAEPGADPGEQAKTELAACLRPMIEELPPDYREAVYLAELQGRTQREVAEVQGLSLSGAKSRVQRGRAMLQEMLAACCDLKLDRRGHIIDYDKRNSSCSRC